MATIQENEHGKRAEHVHGHGHGHRHTEVAAPQTEGLLIRRARFYDVRLRLMFLGRIGAVRALPLDLAAIRPGERVLDVGCGTGELTLAASRRTGPGGSVYGIDAAPEMIEVARHKAERAGQAVHFLVEPVEALNFADGSFDVVLSSFMMHHLPADLKRRALTEIRRVLRPGGRLVIVDLQPTTQLPRFWQPGWLVIRLHKQRTSTAVEVRAAQEARATLLREAGFEKVESGATRYPWIGYTLGRVPQM
jgi:ubiquinone/menaquinone biosynthesis C-methylase UbiE